jgi:hypothetical protein
MRLYAARSWSRLALGHKEPNLAETNSSEGGRIAPDERLLEAELCGVKLDGGGDIGDGNPGLDFVAFDQRRRWNTHGFPAYHAAKNPTKYLIYEAILPSSRLFVPATKDLGSVAVTSGVR